ncbi:hypothetical protein JYK02_13350 [Corallococcus macrosporus]|uniref:Uncharacterized protein n=1 Tax=Corallococcus macrosporus TaxID=35 RepID=A0ABS3DCA1_9BACT|nr:hypothetical protein [Corallococcus macrosporus]MBN8228491.1 hypothetical protein [Corallococcus macrosporus]
MDKQDMQKPKKLSLKRETVRLLSNSDAEMPGRKDLTSPFCTEGPRCEL